MGIVRRCVADEWLRLRRDYFTADFIFTLSLRLIHSHPVVLVDEPWGKFHITGSNRVSSRLFDPRRFSDIQKFLHDFRPLVGATPCGPIDIALIGMWVRLIRTRRYQEAAAVADWMRERGISRRTAIRRQLLSASRRRIQSWVPCSRPYVL